MGRVLGDVHGVRRGKYASHLHVPGRLESYVATLAR